MESFKAKELHSQQRTERNSIHADQHTQICLHAHAHTPPIVSMYCIHYNKMQMFFCLNHQANQNCHRTHFVCCTVHISFCYFVLCYVLNSVFLSFCLSFVLCFNEKKCPSDYRTWCCMRLKGKIVKNAGKQ